MFYGKISMMNLVDRHSLTYLDKFITSNMFFDDGFHIIIHSGRERIGLFDVFELISDLFDITDKSHIQHSIDLIQDEIFCNTDIDDFLIHKIHQPSWGCNNDSRIPFEMSFLDIRTRSSIQTSKSHTIKFRQISDLFAYLNDKFSCRSKYQSL